MNRKNKLLTLLGVLAVLCVMTFAAGKLNAPVDTSADDAEDEIETAAQNVVAAEIPADNVTGFTVVNGESTLALSRTNGEWLARQDLDFPIDAEKVADTLATLEHVTATQKLETPEALETYGLSEPDETLTVSLSDGTTTTFVFGDTNSLTGDLYALVNDTVYTLDASFADEFTTNLYDYVKYETLPTVESAVSLTVTQGKDYSFSLYRTEEAADLTWQKDAVWCFEKSGITRVSNTAKAEALMDMLSGLNWMTCVNAHADIDDMDVYGLTDEDALHITLVYIDENGDEQTLSLLIGVDAANGAYARLDGSTQVYTLSTDTADALRYVTYDSMCADEILPLDMETVSSFAVAISGETTEIAITEVDATVDESESEDDSTAETNAAKAYTTDSATLDSEKVRKLFSALTSLKRSGATINPDTGRPMIALTFHCGNSDVLLTLYAFDTENVLAEVNGEIGLLVMREDAENIVDLTLEMLKKE